ncbi:Fe-S-cluster-containing hydrogenase component 2 [Desulfitispora alkaliphila]|uniref:4Fe-4S dicluster domain-containing protein n=1 Tax=Desulfitispora alkaliphila TaxID=622674 RepID=UPI003D1D6110
MSKDKKDENISKDKDLRYMFLTRRTFMIGTAAAGSALALSGCGENKTNGTGTTKPSGDPKKITEPSYISVDYDKCVGCRICEVECAMHHNNGVPDLDKSRIKVYKYNPMVDIPAICAGCNDAPCLEACPDELNAMKRDETTGAILINEENCVENCTLCIDACKDRANVLRRSKENDTAVGLCGLCDGEYPKCVEACPEDCLYVVPIYLDGQYWAAEPKEIAKRVVKSMYRGSKEAEEFSKS